MTPARLEELLEIASRATPGPWSKIRHHKHPCYTVWRHWFSEDIQTDVATEIGNTITENNADYLLSFDPPTVTALLKLAKQALVMREEFDVSDKDLESEWEKEMKLWHPMEIKDVKDLFKIGIYRGVELFRAALKGADDADT